MNKKILVSLAASALFSLGFASQVPSQPVAAARSAVVLQSKSYVYNHKGKRSKKFYKKNQRLTYTSLKKIKGRTYYRIGKNQYILKAKPATAAKKKPTKPVATQNDPTKNAASLMDFIANNSSLTQAQKQEAQTAANMLRTGQLADQPAPSWFKTYVNLGAQKDATSSANIQASLANLAEVNKARRAVNENELKVSLISTAISMVDSDYQKRGDLNHPQYYTYGENLENLAAGAAPVALWLTEKADWAWNVKKNPRLAPYEFSPNWGDKDYTAAVLGTNGYKTAGHYTNLLNKEHRVMGMAHMTQNNYGYVDAFNATDQGENSALTLSQYQDLVNQWLKL